MTQNDLLNFIKNNNGEPIIDYYDRCIDKLKTLTSYSNRLTLYGIVVAVVYYISKNSQIESYSLGPFTIHDLSFFQKVSSPAFSFILMEWFILASHRSQLLKIVKFIGLSIYNTGITANDLNNSYFNDKIRAILPYSFFMDINSLFEFGVKKKPDPMGLIFLPLIILPVLPFWALFVMIRNCYIDFPHDILAWISNITTIYLVLCLILFFIRTYRKGIKIQKADQGISQ